MFSIFFLQIEPFLKVLVDDRSRAFLLQKLLSATRRILQGRWRSSPGSVVCGANRNRAARGLRSPRVEVRLKLRMLLAPWPTFE